MFLRNDHGLELAGGGAPGGAVARQFGRAVAVPPTRVERWRHDAQRIDWVPDLGAAIFTRDWWRGLATCTALCAVTWALAPAVRPLTGNAPAPLAGAEWDEARAQAIAPLAFGATTGRRMAAGDLVAPLAEAPERPQVELAATLGEGDAFDRVLERAGVGRVDAAAAAALVRQEVALADIAPGTRITLTLGRRASKTVARPLERLALRARFDLALSLSRAGAALTMQRHPIAIDSTPLRLQGLVGASLYRSARAAGAPGKVVEAYIRAIATKMSIGRDITAADRFDMVIERDRAATGETRTGKLLLAAIDQGAKSLQLVRWQGDGGEEWWDAHGQIRHVGAMAMPVSGRVTSGFGWRFHPILGFSRMHKGVDIGVPYGSPIKAAIEGTVAFAGWHGGHGKFVQLAHAGNIQTGYGHMSSIAVRPGEHVSQGEVIGYVGMTGLTTGPHLHWEVTKNGVYINPLSISYASIATLPDADMRRFKARVAELLQVKVGG